MEMATKFHLIKKDIDNNLYIDDKYSRIMLNSCDICGFVVTCCDLNPVSAVSDPQVAIFTASTALYAVGDPSPSKPLIEHQ